MKLRLQFGLVEPAREINWWQRIDVFPTLVLYKGTKWQFIVYSTDLSKQVDYICNFSEVASYDPTWHVTTYENIDYMFNMGLGPRCECGALFSSFPWDHMKYCPKWVPWNKL